MSTRSRKNAAKIVEFPPPAAEEHTSRTPSVFFRFDILGRRTPEKPQDPPQKQRQEQQQQHQQTLTAEILAETLLRELRDDAATRDKIYAIFTRMREQREEKAAESNRCPHCFGILPTRRAA